MKYTNKKCTYKVPSDLSTSDLNISFISTSLLLRIRIKIRNKAKPQMVKQHLQRNQLLCLNFLVGFRSRLPTQIERISMIIHREHRRTMNKLLLCRRSGFTVNVGLSSSSMMSSIGCHAN
jgi:hypothetical protein